MEDNSTVNRFVIPNNPYMNEIYNLVKGNQIELSDINIEDTLKYIRASAFLGYVNKTFIPYLEKCINTYEDVINLSNSLRKLVK